MAKCNAEVVSYEELAARLAEAYALLRRSIDATEEDGIGVIDDIERFLGAADDEKNFYIEALQARLAEAEAERAALVSVVASARERAEHAEARRASVEALLREVYDGRQSPMSVGLVYRIGHTLNHCQSDSAASQPTDREEVGRG